MGLILPLALCLGLAAFAVLLGVLYLRHVDHAIAVPPPEAIALSPQRWSQEAIAQAAKEMEQFPLSAVPHLPPKTGRRYIVVGGSGERDRLPQCAVVSLG